MINDWASKARPDLLHFIPYTWRFTLLMKEFEFIMPANEYNWIDCSSQSHENSRFILNFPNFIQNHVPSLCS